LSRGCCRRHERDRTRSSQLWEAESKFPGVRPLRNLSSAVPKAIRRRGLAVLGRNGSLSRRFQAAWDMTPARVLTLEGTSDDRWHIASPSSSSTATALQRLAACECSGSAGWQVRSDQVKSGQVRSAGAPFTLPGWRQQAACFRPMQTIASISWGGRSAVHRGPVLGRRQGPCRASVPFARLARPEGRSLGDGTVTGARTLA
jgi:hypothetical protein